LVCGPRNSDARQGRSATIANVKVAKGEWTHPTASSQGWEHATVVAVPVGGVVRGEAQIVLVAGERDREHRGHEAIAAEIIIAHWAVERDAVGKGVLAMVTEPCCAHCL
jgi:hypothetical protein